MNQSLAFHRTIVATEIEAFGGAERSLLALSRWLYEHDVPNYLLLYTDGCNLQEYVNHPLKVVELRPPPGMRNRISAFRRHFQQVGATPYKPLLSGYQSALHATLGGLRGFHDLMHDTPALMSTARKSLKNRLRTSLSNCIVGYGLRSGGRTFVNSEFLRDECRRDFGVRADIVRMGGIASYQRPSIRTVTDQLRMLSVCRIEFNKRLDWILRALAALEHEATPLSSRVNWRMDFVGNGTLIQPLTKLAADSGIADRVYFHGFLPDNELNHLYEGAHLFLMPAIQGYGIPAIESLQRGIPVLLHRESGVSDVLLDTPWATVLDGDESSMLPGLRRAIDNVIQGQHHSVAQPTIPTEDEWAERIARLCNWLD